TCCSDHGSKHPAHRRPPSADGSCTRMAAVTEPSTDPFGPLDRAGYAAADAVQTVRGNRRWWDREAAAYLAEHGAFLGDSDEGDFVWGPEGLHEADARLLGE